MAEGGRGKKGGLSEYAREIGKSHQYLSQVSSAAKLATQVAGLDTTQLLNKAKHLAAIHGCPSQHWQTLTELLIERDWSVRETEAIAAELDDLYQEFAKQAKDKQRQHGGTAPGKSKSLPQKFAEVIESPKKEARETRTKVAQAVGVGSTAVKQAKRVER